MENIYLEVISWKTKSAKAILAFSEAIYSAIYREDEIGISIGKENKIMYDSLLNFMNQIDADGIDFLELNFPTNDKIIASYTKEEFAKDGLIYKTNRLYWRMINGVKNYYYGENKSGYVIWKDLEQLKEENNDSLLEFGEYKNEENIQSYFDTKF